MKLDFNNIWSQIKHSSPHLMTAFGVIGVFGTAVSSAFATKRYLDQIKNVNDKKSKAKIGVKCYIPTFALGLSSAACIIGSDVENTRRNAALAEACSMASVALNDYRGKVTELMGDKADNDICNAINQDYESKGETSKRIDMVVMTSKKQMVYDMFSGRYIWTSLDELRDVEIEANRRLRRSQAMSVSDVYDLFDDVERTPSGNNEGFNINLHGHDEIRFGYDSKLGSDKQAYLAFYFEVEPTDRYLIF